MYVKRILPNGVRLITERIDNMRTVSVGIWVGNGSRYEPAELGGVSHFIEHMIFINNIGIFHIIINHITI